jgi:hypothetical protein
MPTYDLTLTAKQAAVVSEALELYFRLLMGQTEEIPSFYIRHRADLLPDDCEEMRTAMMYVKEAAFHDLSGRGHSHGIADGRIGPDAPIACDIHQVIRHRLAWDKLAPGEERTGQVFYNEPHRVSKDEELPVMTKRSD